MRLSLCFGLIAALSPLTAQADAVSDALDAAVSAYAAGDLAQTSVSLSTAGKELATLQSNLMLAAFPAAPEGWTRADNADMAAGMAMFGGGAGAEATYTAPDGQTLTISTFADNGMVSSVAGMLDDPAMLAMMGKSVEINGVTFLEQEGNTLMALLQKRVLVQANGDPAQAKEILAQFDLAKLAAFDQK